MGRVHLRNRSDWLTTWPYFPTLAKDDTGPQTGSQPLLDKSFHPYGIRSLVVGSGRFNTLAPLPPPPPSSPLFVPSEGAGGHHTGSMADINIVEVQSWIDSVEDDVLGVDALFAYFKKCAPCSLQSHPSAHILP